MPFAVTVRLPSAVVPPTAPPKLTRPFASVSTRLWPPSSVPPKPILPAPLTVTPVAPPSRSAPFAVKPLPV